MMRLKNKISSRVVILNLAICSKYGSDFAINRPHDLALLDKQFEQLSQKGKSYQVAHLAYMINKLKPFAQENLKTAILLTLYLTSTKIDFLEISNLLKSGAEVSDIASLVAS